MSKKPHINGSALIKSTGMKLEPLAARLNIPYDTLQAYSCGKRNMPAEVAEKIRELIEKMK